MVIATSDSCNTLISLGNGAKPYQSGCEGQNPEEQYFQTNLFLPADEYLDVEFDQVQQPIYLPESGRADECLKHVPQIVESCDELLANPPRVFDSNSTERVLYVGQGEAAHAVPLQADVIVSDKATTCHILAFRSESDENDVPLTSLTHIDGPSYDSCIRSMVYEHIAHHQSRFQEEKKGEVFDDRIDFQVHVVGGFEDSDLTSCAISNWLMKLLSDIAEEHKDVLKVTLKTCAISSLNDNGYSCPIGRGLGLDLRTGEAFLAKVKGEAAGPAVEIRSVRLWSGPKALLVTHTAKSNNLCIDAFSYQPFPGVEQLLHLPDETMLRFTSTSPTVEEAGFCQSVRSTLRFLRDVDCTAVFGPAVDQPLVFRRESASNKWKRYR